MKKREESKNFIIGFIIRIASFVFALIVTVIVEIIRLWVMGVKFYKTKRNKEVDAIKKFKKIAATMQGWPLIGEPYLGQKIPFFGQVLSYQLQTGNGPEEYTSLIRHFGWSVCFGLTTDNNVITLAQWKPGVNQVSWELPPGGIGKTDSITPEDLLERTKNSFLKETGYGKGEFEYLGKILIETGKYRGASLDDHGLPAHLFLAKGLECVQGARNPNPNEKLETILVPLGEFRSVLESGLFLEESAVACAYKALIELGVLRWT